LQDVAGEDEQLNQLSSEVFAQNTPKKGLASFLSKSQPATTVSQKKPKKSLFTFFEDQPPHLRNCLPEQLELLTDSGDLDLSVKLKDLTQDSFFAVHYNFLK